MNAEDIYAKMPVFVQGVLCSLQGWRITRQRYGPRFLEAESELRRQNGYSNAQMAESQRQKLRTVLSRAAQSDFWAQRFRDFTVNIEAEDPYEELAKLPVLSKTEIQRNPEAFLVPGLATGRNLKVHTSGTTGAGLVFWETPEANAARWALWWRYRQWHGISKDEWCGFFGGRSVVPSKQKAPPYWRVNWPGRQVLFSAYHLSESSAHHYLQEISSRRLAWLHGYPSVLTLIADYALTMGVDLSRHVKWVTTGAESLSMQQRKLIERGLGARVREHYGQAEGVANFSECPEGKLHVDEDYALVEFLPTDSPGQFRIIGTNLTNHLFPLLRYDTSDLVTLTNADCSCGCRGRIVDAVDGRKEDYLVLSDHTRVGRLDHIFKDMVEIREAQFHQSTPGTADLLIVKGTKYSQECERRIQKEIRKRLGDRIDVRIHYATSVIRTRNGKLRLVLSNCKIQ